MVHAVSTLVLVFVAMALKDVASNASVFLVSRQHGLWAGVADGLSDIAAVFSIGVTGALTVTGGLTLATWGALLGLVAGSLVGGVVGTRLGKRAADHLDTRTAEGDTE